MKYINSSNISSLYSTTRYNNIISQLWSSNGAVNNNPKTYDLLSPNNFLHGLFDDDPFVQVTIPEGTGSETLIVPSIYESTVEYPYHASFGSMDSNYSPYSFVESSLHGVPIFNKKQWTFFEINDGKISSANIQGASGQTANTNRIVDWSGYSTIIADDIISSSQTIRKSFHPIAKFGGYSHNGFISIPNSAGGNITVTGYKRTNLVTLPSNFCFYGLDLESNNILFTGFKSAFASYARTAYSLSTGELFNTYLSSADTILTNLTNALTNTSGTFNESSWLYTAENYPGSYSSDTHNNKTDKWLHYRYMQNTSDDKFSNLSYNPIGRAYFSATDNNINYTLTNACTSFSLGVNTSTTLYKIWPFIVSYLITHPIVSTNGSSPSGSSSNTKTLGYVQAFIVKPCAIIQKPLSITSSSVKVTYNNTLQPAVFPAAGQSDVSFGIQSDSIGSADDISPKYYSDMPGVSYASYSPILKIESVASWPNQTTLDDTGTSILKTTFLDAANISTSMSGGGSPGGEIPLTAPYKLGTLNIPANSTTENKYYAIKVVATQGLSYDGNNIYAFTSATSLKSNYMSQLKSNAKIEMAFKGLPSNQSISNNNLLPYYVPNSGDNYWYKVDISCNAHAAGGDGYKVKILSSNPPTTIPNQEAFDNLSAVRNGWAISSNETGYQFADYENSQFDSIYSGSNYITTTNKSIYVKAPANNTNLHPSAVLLCWASGDAVTDTFIIPLQIGTPSLSFSYSGINSGIIQIDTTAQSNSVSPTIAFTNRGNFRVMGYYKSVTYNAETGSLTPGASVTPAADAKIQSITAQNAATIDSFDQSTGVGVIVPLTNQESTTTVWSINPGENPYDYDLYKVIEFNATGAYQGTDDGYIGKYIIIHQSPAYLDVESSSATASNYGEILQASINSSGKFKYTFLADPSTDNAGLTTSSKSWNNQSQDTSIGSGNYSNKNLIVPQSQLNPELNVSTTYKLKVWLANNSSISKIVNITQPCAGFVATPDRSNVGAEGGTVTVSVVSSSSWWCTVTDPSGNVLKQLGKDASTNSIDVSYGIPAASDTTTKVYKFNFYLKNQGSVPSGDPVNGANYFYAKSISITQGGVGENPQFELYQQTQSTIAPASISYGKDGSTNRIIYVKNTGNVASKYKYSTTGDNIATFTTATPSGEIAKNAFWAINYNVASTTASEPRRQILQIQDASYGYPYKTIELIQSGGQRSVDVSIRSGSTILAKEAGSVTFGIKNTNDANITSTYTITLDSPYSQNEFTITKSSVVLAKGASDTFTLTYTKNASTERRTGISITVRDDDAYEIFKSFYFIQNAYPEPFFNMGTTYCSGKTLVVNEYVNPGVSFRTNLTDLADPLLQFEISSNKPRFFDSIASSPAASSGGRYFNWITANLGSVQKEPEEIEIYVDCYYNDNDVKSNNYNKYNPFRRTIQFVLNTTITPSIKMDNAGMYFIQSGGTESGSYTYLFGPGSGIRTYSLRDEYTSPDNWYISSISGNAGSYLFGYCNPMNSTTLTTVSLNTVSEITDPTNNSAYGSGTINIKATSLNGITMGNPACDTQNNTASNSTYVVYTYRFPLPSLEVYYNTTGTTPLNNGHCIFDYTGKNLSTNTNSLTIRLNKANPNISLSGYTNTETSCYYEIDNNLFSIEESGNALIITAPQNTSLSENIKGTLTFYYNYPSNIPDHTEDLIKKYTLIVQPANTPNITLDPSKTSYSFNYDGSSQDGINGPNQDGYYKINLSSASSLPLTWNFEKEEFGTNGSEFKFVRTAEGIQFAVPVNTDINTYKECNLTISYWYTADSTKESLQTKYLTFSVAPAPELKIIPDTSVQYAKGYNNDNDFNPIDISITAANGAQISGKTPVEWKIERTTEFGTTGSEFNFRKVGNQIQINTVPDNMSVNNTKSATVVAKAYYRGQENAYSVNGIYEYIVNPMNRLSIQEVGINMIPNSYAKNSHSDDTNMNAFYIDDPTGNTTEGIRYVAYKIVDGSGNNLTNSDAVIIKTNKSETGTNGNEYRITAADITTDINGDPIYIITVRIPSYNVSTTHQKECDITIEASYRNGDSNYNETNIKHYNIDIAPKFYVEFVEDPSILNNYTYKGIRRNRDADTITPKFVLKDVNTNAVLNNISNTRINQFLMWTFNTEETNTTGREFTVLHNPDIQAISTTLPGGYVYNAQNANNWYTVTAPENFIINKDKTCTVTLTAKYLNNNDDFVINYECRYIVSAAGKLVLSFTDPRDAQFDWKYDLTTDTVIPLDGENSNIEIGLTENIPNGETFNIYTDTDYIAWSFEKTEVNTNGNEFSVSKNNVDGLAINTLPKNTSISNAKICNITFKAWYKAGDPNDFAALTGVYRVIPASGFTTEIDPRSFTFDPDGQGLTDLSTYIKIKDASDNYIHDGIADISINIVPEYVNSVESEWNYAAMPDTDNTNDVYYWINLNNYPTNLTTSSKELKLNITCGYNNGSYSITDTITYKVLPSGFPEIKFIDLNTMTQSDTLLLEFGPDESSKSVNLITNKRNNLLKADTWHYYNRAVTPPEKSNVSGQLDLYAGDKVVGYMSRGYGNFIGQTVDGSDQPVWLSEFTVTLYDSENLINDNEFSVYLIGSNIIGDSQFITLTIRQQKASTEYKPEIHTSSVFYDPSNSKFYNMGFPYYWSDKDKIADNWNDAWPENTADDYEFNRVIFDSNVAEIVPESEGIEIQRVSDIRPVDINYHQRKNSVFPYITIDPTVRTKNNKRIQRFNVSLSYTNALFGFAVTDPPTEYKFRAYATVRYRRGSSDHEKWYEEKIYGEWIEFVYLALYNKDEEFIRPYFKPMEHEKGYLTGTEVKNFINSKGVVFNRSENNIIELTNFFNNYEIVDGKIKINITNALIEHILYNEAFNKAWNYINDSDNLLKAKTAYIRNIILPNIIVNADSTVEIYENSKSSSLSISRSINDNFKQIENTGTQFEIEENQDKTLVFNGLKNKTYFFKVKVSF